jgi:(2R)-sulfolactate sulfo-lyase subunit alpha
MSEPSTILLSPLDNVVVCRRNIAAGERLVIDGVEVPARSEVPLGHKIARRVIVAGEEVIKYGMAIGSVTMDVQPGDWVHLHNLQSDYIPTHTRDDEARS